MSDRYLGTMTIPWVDPYKGDREAQLDKFLEGFYINPDLTDEEAADFDAKMAEWQRKWDAREAVEKLPEPARSAALAVLPDPGPTPEYPPGDIDEDTSDDNAHVHDFYRTYQMMWQRTSVLYDGSDTWGETDEDIDIFCRHGVLNYAEIVVNCPQRGDGFLGMFADYERIREEAGEHQFSSALSLLCKWFEEDYGCEFPF